MVKRLHIIAVLTLLAASLIVNVVLSRQLNEYRGVLAVLKAEGRLAVGTTLPDIETTGLDGTAQQLSTRSGQPMLLYVFSPQCGWCTRNLKNVQAIAAQTAGRIRTVGLSLTNDELVEYVRANDLRFPVYGRLSGNSEEILKITGTPTTILISADGVVEQIWRGAYQPSMEIDIERRLGVSLPGVDPPPPLTPPAAPSPQ